MRGATLRETLKQLKCCGQIELKSWVCRRCGYPNPPEMSQCRGYLDALHHKVEREVPWWYYIQRERSGRDMRDGRFRAREIDFSNASRYGKGSTRLEHRCFSMAADHSRLPPICGSQEGYFVVPCTGNATQDHGGGADSDAE